MRRWTDRGSALTLAYGAVAFALAFGFMAFLDGVEPGWLFLVVPAAAMFLYAFLAPNPWLAAALTAAAGAGLVLAPYAFGTDWCLREHGCEDNLGPLGNLVFVLIASVVPAVLGALAAASRARAVPSRREA